MSYSTFSDAAAKSPKAQVAGNEAWSLWVAAIMYCNRHNTDGFVPLAALATECLPVPIPIARAKKIGDHLCSMRAPPSQHGYFEKADGGYRVHDFLDWNLSKSQVDSKRKADRERKKFRLESKSDSEEDSVRNPARLLAGIHVDSAAHVRARGRPSLPHHHSRPSPAQTDQSETTTTQDLKGSPVREAEPVAEDQRTARVKKPLAMALTPSEYGQLTLGDPGLTAEFIDAVIADWLTEPADPTLELFDRQWRATAFKVVRSAWRNKRRRDEIHAKLNSGSETVPDPMSVNSPEGWV